MKLKNKGFVLVEFLVSITVVMVLFTSLFMIISPSIDKENKKLKYEDVDKTYMLFHIRKLYMDREFDIKDGEYINIYDGNKCSYIAEEKIEKCTKLAKAINAQEIIITNSNIKALKNTYQGKLKDYIDYLPITKEDKYLRIIAKIDDGYAISKLYVDNAYANCYFELPNGNSILCDATNIEDNNLTKNNFVDSDNVIYVSKEQIGNKARFTINVKDRLKEIIIKEGSIRSIQGYVNKMMSNKGDLNEE